MLYSSCWFTIIFFLCDLADVDEQLMKVARIDSCPEREKYVILLMDEMHIKADLSL